MTRGKACASGLGASAPGIGSGYELPSSCGALARGRGDGCTGHNQGVHNDEVRCLAIRFRETVQGESGPGRRDDAVAPKLE